MLHSFIGRQYELNLLKSLLAQKNASLVVIKGRRRIGKSRLVEEFAENHAPGYTFFRFSGIAPTPETTSQLQLNEFMRQMSKEMGFPKMIIDNWGDAFALLFEKVKKGKIIILFDEISWMGSKDSEFLSKLKDAWDHYFKKNNSLLLFLCSSVSSWIDQNILSGTAFIGRITMEFTLEELSMHESNLFWESNVYISAYEKLKILSVTGGVPRYLEAIDTKTSADHNIHRLCFMPEGLLVREFNSLFSDLFSSRNAIYKKIVKKLANGPREAEEIFSALGMTYTGTTLDYLEELIAAGFLSRDFTWRIKSGEPSKLSHFRLKDNYSRFFLKYIEPAMPKIKRRGYQFQSVSALPSWDTIMGYQVENLILHNRKFIHDRIGIQANDIITDNPFFQRKTKKLPGCQIDYLIQTRFGGLFACEFKFSKNLVGMSVIDEMRKKIDRLVYPKGFSVWPVLIHVNGVEDDVALSDFFTQIIDLGDLLQSPPTTPTQKPQKKKASPKKTSTKHKTRKKA